MEFLLRAATHTHTHMVIDAHMLNLIDLLYLITPNISQPSNALQWIIKGKLIVSVNDSTFDKSYQMYIY